MLVSSGSSDIGMPQGKKKQERMQKYKELLKKKAQAPPRPCSI